MPAFQYQKQLIDIWFDAFPTTTLLMNFDEPQALTYGTGRGAGSRLDCLGDLRVKSDNPYFQPEMLDIYPSRSCAREFRMCGRNGRYRWRFVALFRSGREIASI